MTNEEMRSQMAVAVGELVGRVVAIAEKYAQEKVTEVLVRIMSKMDKLVAEGQEEQEQK